MTKWEHRKFYKLRKKHLSVHRELTHRELRKYIELNGKYCLGNDLLGDK